MEKFVKSLQYKILIILLIPAIGLIYFSSTSVYSNYVAYQRSRNLQKEVEYAQYALLLVQNLQKERGLSILALSDPKYRNSLKAARQKSDKLVNKFLDFLYRNDFDAGVRIKEIIAYLDKLHTLRKQIDQNKMELLAIMHQYSKAIERLIASTQILHNDYINEEFLRYALTFHNILELTEISGKQRALIAFLLSKTQEQKSLLPKIIELEIQYQALKKLLEKNMPYQVAILFKKKLPISLQNDFEGLKKSIINHHQFLKTSKQWWNIATRYIDTLFVIEYDVLKKIIHFQYMLKQKAFYTLLWSAVIWILAIISLVIFLQLFNDLLQKITLYYNIIKKDKSLYSIFSEFSENVLHIDNFQALVNLFAVFLDKTALFKFLYITNCKNDEIVAVEKVAISFINENLKELLADTIEDVRAKRQHKVLAIKHKELLAHDIKSIAIFPILLSQKCRLILVVASKNTISTRVIDVVMRMIDIFESSLQQLELQKRQKDLQEELALLSHTFEAHEAIVITDKNGDIVKVNKAFEEITGYKEQEVLGKNPSILKSGKHSVQFYEKMWRDIKEKGYWKGEIYNRKKDGTIYPEILSITAIRDKNGEIKNYISHFFDISDLKKIQEENERRATHDLLTEIFNRGKLLEELEIVRHTAKKEQFLNAFLFIDLDNFKYINDSYGHAVGDKVLIEVSQKLKSIKKERDIVARISGDEFALVLVDIGKDLQAASSRAAIVAQKLLDIYEKPVIINDIEIDIAFSIGIYIFPMDEKGPEDVITNADIAMYYSKKNGKRSFSFYDEKLDIESKQFLVMKREIEKGIKNGEFKIFYQPKVALQTGEVVGFEALIRWDSILYGFLYPDKFFSFIKGTRLVYDMTMYVVEHVLKDMERMHHYKDVEVAINISTEQFNNKRFMQELYNKLMDKKASSIILEIVEDALVKDTDYAIEQMRKLQDIGVKIAIDDFGTGYSSLSYLRDLPINEIKIDKSFILNLFENKNDVIVEKIVEIAKIFDYTVTAEGVENEKVLRFLQEQGCDYFQGFFYSRAVVLEKALEFLR